MRVAVVMLVIFTVTGCRALLGIEEPVDPDSGVPVVGFQSVTSLYDERSAMVQIPVTLSEAADVEVAIEWELAGGTATPGADFDATEGLITFAPGETLHHIVLLIHADAIESEGDETIRIDLVNPVNARVDSSSRQHLVTIDARLLPRIRFQAGTSMNTEGTQTELVVALDIVSDLDVEVELTRTGTATDPADYTPPTSALVPASTLMQSLALTTADDALDEDSETVIFTLNNPRNVVIDEAFDVHIHTLDDNDPPPIVAFIQASTSASEAAGTVNITVSLSAASGRTVSVPFTRGGTAANVLDFTVATTSPVTFAAGEVSRTITINVVNDAADEPNETVTLQLGTPTNATLGATTNHTLTINDND